MKKRRIFVLAILGVIGCGIAWLAYPFERIYSLGFRDVEIVLRVVDAQTGYPIKGAIVLLRDYDLGVKPTIQSAVTDEDGTAVFVPKRVMSEALIERFRTTRRTFDLGWGAYDVSSEGYEPIENAPLVEYQNQGRVGGSDAFRLQFTVVVQRVSKK